MTRPFIPRRSAAVLLTLAAATISPAAAAAAPEWHSGTNESSYVGNCLLAPEAGITAFAEWQADEQALPRVGDVFYVRTIAGRVGSGCGSGMSVHVEVIPPAGVAPAISAQTPVRCRVENFDTRESTVAPGCPQAAQPGVYGIAFDQVTPGGPAAAQPWEVAYGYALIIEIPMRATRALKGGAPSCGRGDGQPPCTAGQSGDSLQFADKIIDAGSSPWLSPFVSLFVEPGNAPGGGASGGGTRPAGSPPATSGQPAPAGPSATQDVIAAAPRSVSASRLLRGIRVTARVRAAGSRVQATLSVRGRTIARGTIRATSTGLITVRLKASRPAVRRLQRARRPASATLRVRVIAPDGQTQTGVRRVKVR
jgi:hypothetical protein